jgi:hypothetical protein
MKWMELFGGYLAITGLLYGFVLVQRVLHMLDIRKSHTRRPQPPYRKAPSQIHTLYQNKPTSPKTLTHVLKNSLLVRSRRVHLRESLELAALVHGENQDDVLVLGEGLVELLFFVATGGCPLVVAAGDADVFVVATFDHEVLCRWL